MTTEVKHYRKFMFTYGLLSVLYVLQHFEDEEEFEECQKIIDAIKEQEERLECKLFTKITQKSIDEVISNYKKFNLTGKNAVENSQFYSELIIKEINTKYN